MSYAEFDAIRIGIASPEQIREWYKLFFLLDIGIGVYYEIMFSCPMDL